MFKTKLKNSLTRVSLAIPVLLVAFEANAHPGGHMEFSMSQIISHVFASPFHVGIIASGFLITVFLLKKGAKHKAIKRAKSKDTNK